MEDTDRWRAIAHDGAVIDEDDDSAGIVRRRGWAEVDASQVAVIQLREGATIVAACIIPPDATPVLFRRRTIAVQTNGADEHPQETGRQTVTIIGWAYPDGAACWLWRQPDGHVALSAGELRVVE